jgi:hypothetical protein
MTHGTTTSSMTHTHDEARSAEMCARGGKLAVLRVDGAVRDGWASRRATDSLNAQHDVEGLVTQLLLEKARLQSSVQDMARSCMGASREHRAQMGRAAWTSRNGARLEKR